MAAVVVIGGIVYLASGPKKTVRRRSRPVVVAPKRLPSTKNWYNIGMREGYGWKSHAKARESVAGGAGGGGNAFDPKNVHRMADMMTSDWYKKGIREDPDGEKRFIQGFEDAVLGKR